MKMLAKSKGYPWRASLTKKARCATCEFLINEFKCSKGNKVKFPTYNKKHDCTDFRFKSKIFICAEHDVQSESQFPECSECIHNLNNCCDGIKWRPIRKVNLKCEFFRPKNLICKNAIPYFQYCNGLRNNYCKLPPYKRDVPDFQKHWSWNCPYAHHKGIERFNCYKPKISSKKG